MAVDGGVGNEFGFIRIAFFGSFQFWVPIGTVEFRIALRVPRMEKACLEKSELKCRKLARHNLN